MLIELLKCATMLSRSRVCATRLRSRSTPELIRRVQRRFAVLVSAVVPATFELPVHVFRGMKVFSRCAQTAPDGGRPSTEYRRGWRKGAGKAPDKPPGAGSAAEAAPPCRARRD